MHKPFSRTLTVALAFGACCFAVPQATTAIDSHTLHFKPPIGKPMHYDMSMSMNANGTPMEIAVVFTMTATKFVANKYTIEATYDSVKAPGLPEDQMKSLIEGSKVTEVIDSTGHLISTTTEGPLKEMMKGMSFGADSSVFDHAKAKVGDTWVSTVQSAGKSMKLNITLLSVKSVDGTELATYRSEATEEAKSDYPGSSVFVIETATGTMRSMEMTNKAGSNALIGMTHMLIKLRP
jgi:hypothetical protein